MFALCLRCVCDLFAACLRCVYGVFAVFAVLIAVCLRCVCGVFASADHESLADALTANDRYLNGLLA